MNTRIDDKNYVLSRWIFTEAQTGKIRLDTHYSFINKHFKNMWRMTMLYSLEMIL